METVKLRASDGLTVKIDSKIAEHMRSIRLIIHEYSQDEEEITISLPKIDTPLLWKILDWCIYHRDLQDEQQEECWAYRDDADDLLYMTRWEADFLDVDTNTLIKYIMAALHLDLKCLLSKARAIMSATGKEDSSNILKEYLEQKFFQ
ncbi:unnamed protein product [Hermetia illucens]|uniref:SKP1 component POZ domain-containing protein n=1 Tax=Hermetia illucens TaxID=343691 RepID=A0A7R8UEH7_HERIL|nr:E3 ubiquitin ligase complex SCF subunit sconC-like [Hermetia illucens]CAD7079223.1 unnamed protein product [Hermetia illucens]